MSFATFPNSQRPSPQTRTPTPRPAPITKSPNAATTTFAQRQANQPFRAQPKPVTKVNPMANQPTVAPPPPVNTNPSFGGGKAGGGSPFFGRPKPYDPSMGGTPELYDQFNRSNNRMTADVRPTDVMTFQEYVKYNNMPTEQREAYGYNRMQNSFGEGGIGLGNTFGGLGSMVVTAANNALQNSLQAPQPFNQNPNPVSNMGGGGMPNQSYNGQLDLSGMMRPDAQAAAQSQMDFFNQGQQPPQNMAQMGANASSTGGKSTSGPSTGYSAFGGGKSGR